MKALYLTLLCVYIYTMLPTTYSTDCTPVPCFYCMRIGLTCSIVETELVENYEYRGYNYTYAKQCHHLQHGRDNQICNFKGEVNACHRECGRGGCYRSSETCDGRLLYFRATTYCDKTFAEANLNIHYNTTPETYNPLKKINDAICANFQNGTYYNGPCSTAAENSALDDADTKHKICAVDRYTGQKRVFPNELEMLKHNCLYRTYYKKSNTWDCPNNSY